MKFLIDAQLPVRLAAHLAGAGHDVLHSSDLPDCNRTSDSALSDVADQQQRVMVTKNRDFEVSHTVGRRPRRLLLVTTGNVTNATLIQLFGDHLHVIEAEFESADYVELSSDAVIVHRRFGEG